MWLLARLVSASLFLAGGWVVAAGLRAGDDRRALVGLTLLLTGVAVEILWQWLRRRAAAGTPDGGGTDTGA